MFCYPIYFPGIKLSSGHLNNQFGSNGLGVLERSPQRCLEQGIYNTVHISISHGANDPGAQIQDVTETLRELPVQPRDELFNPEKIDYVKTLECQVTCGWSWGYFVPYLSHITPPDLSWSRQADFGLQPSPLIDGSLLALANRRGSIILMRRVGGIVLLTSLYLSSFFLDRCGAEPLLRSVGIIRVSDKWVTQVAWSSWICEKPYFCEYPGLAFCSLTWWRAQFNNRCIALWINTF